LFDQDHKREPHPKREAGSQSPDAGDRYFSIKESVSARARFLRENDNTTGEMTAEKTETKYVIQITAEIADDISTRFVRPIKTSSSVGLRSDFGRVLESEIAGVGRRVANRPTDRKPFDLLIRGNERR
jgi:hypothetical protein